jgi:hypothetical protein
MSTLSEFSPLTSTGHIIHAPRQNLMTAIQEILEKMFRQLAVVQQTPALGTTLRDALPFLDPVCEGPYPTRVLVLPCRLADWHVVFNNAWRSQGWPNMMIPITHKLETDDYYFFVQENTLTRDGDRVRGQYGSIQFIKIDCGKAARTICSGNEGGKWVFFAQGQPLPFEDLARYSAKRIRERFTKDMLTSYLADVRLFPFDESFFAEAKDKQSSGFRMKITAPDMEARYRETPLKAFQREHGPFD